MRFEISPERCVSCLACVRVCAVDAIEVSGDTVRIVDDACVRSGRCVPACPHDAITALGDVARAVELLGTGRAVLILGVEADIYFYPRAPEQVVNACHAIGFRAVHRGIEGDELVAAAYQDVWQDRGWGTMIRSTCPVVVNKIRQDYPELVPYLAPVKTPLAAEVSYLRSRYGEHVEIVHAGVCNGEPDPHIAATITYAELARMFQARGVALDQQPTVHERIPEERRRHLSTAGGMPLQVLEDEPQSSRRFRKYRGLSKLEVIARAVAEDRLDLGFIDILPCEGCLDHPLLGPREKLFWRRQLMERIEPPRSPVPVMEGPLVDVGAEFELDRDNTRASEAELVKIVDEIGRGPNGRPWDCGACGYDSCSRFAQALIRGRATLRQCTPYQEKRAVEASRAAAVDELTGLATLRVLRDRLEQELARSGRSGEPFAVLFADMDNFKRINDAHGHEAGSEVLARVGEEMGRLVRGTDLAARYGGDEFVLVLIRTDARGAIRVAESVRKAVLALGDRMGYEGGAVSISVGVASHDPRVGSEGDVLTQADKALYAAKASGGNTVAVMGPGGELGLN